MLLCWCFYSCQWLLEDLSTGKKLKTVESLKMITWKTKINLSSALHILRWEFLSTYLCYSFKNSLENIFPGVKLNPDRHFLRSVWIYRHVSLSIKLIRKSIWADTHGCPSSDHLPSPCFLIQRDPFFLPLLLRITRTKLTSIWKKN